MVFLYYFRIRSYLIRLKFVIISTSLRLRIRNITPSNILKVSFKSFETYYFFEAFIHFESKISRKKQIHFHHRFKVFMEGKGYPNTLMAIKYFQPGSISVSYFKSGTSAALTFDNDIWYKELF